MLFLETQQDTLNVKASLLGIDDAFAQLGRALPVVLSVSIESWGTMLAGQPIESLYVSVAHRDLFAIGLNCATGPDFMTDHLRTLAEISRFPISCFPNAGLPDEEGHYNELPPMLAKKIERFCAEGWINIIGGCCGTTAEHIRMIAEIAAPLPAAPAGRRCGAASSPGSRRWSIDDDTRPVIVGERTNVLGSRKFKELIADGKFEEASEVGRAAGAARRARARRLPAGSRSQRDGGPHHVPRDAGEEGQGPDHDRLHRRQRRSRRRSKRTQGKSIINSINLEDGEERFERVVPLARRYGAALVVGCIDEDKQQAQAITRERKLADRAALARAADEEVRRRRRGHLSSTRWCSRSAPATRTTSAPASRRSKASA